jgi:hypothetical protein
MQLANLLTTDKHQNCVHWAALGGDLVSIYVSVYAPCVHALL